MLGLGGAERMLADICYELLHRGHSIKVLTLFDPHYSFEKFPNKEKFLTDCAVEQISMNTRLSIFPPGIKIEAPRYEKILQEFKPDVIHSHLFQAEILAHSVFFPNAVYFSHVHDNMFQLESVFKSGRYKRRWSDFFERAWILRRYRKFNNHFIAISKDTLEFSLRVLPRKIRSNVSILRNAFNYKAFSNNIQRSINPNEPLRLVSIGNLVPKKNHKLLVSVCEQLHKKGIDFRCDILGYGSQEQLQQQINLAGLNERVFLRGTVSDVQYYLKYADIYVHPASYEPFGLVILEAMAAGLPVICRNGQGNLDIHEEGKTGYLIEGDEPEKFADRIINLMDNPEKYREISAYNREYCKQYDISHYCEKLTNIYVQALNKTIS
ncbi:MAG: hypothetical protein RLZZ46_1321 [Bacteroidota bacterium]|jgi:glycosyltransferase involved in cell wall biosynthesis